MGKLFSRSIAKIVTILSLTSLVQAAQFHLPNRIPGFVGQTRAPFAGNNPRGYEKVTVPGTTCDLFFPIDGSQPRTSLAGRYSGARYNGPNTDAVTDWWVRVFGGTDAVESSYLIPHIDTENNVFMGFNYLYGYRMNPIHIITLPVVDNPVGFKRAFWTTFRTIAADPVGRVLLYRLLIEIGRFDGRSGNVCCGDDTNVIDLKERNRCRTITIEYSDRGCSFSFLNRIIRFCTIAIETFTFIQEIQNGINLLTTRAERRNNSIGLFHEMLHWFHFLRNPDKLVNNLNANPENFKYTGRCYYGNISEICLWGGNTNVEEIATILGSPNYNTLRYNNLINTEAFLNYNPGLGVSRVTINGQQRYIPNSDLFLSGDDLSENAYRASQGCHMRFGHVNQAIRPIIMNPIPNHIQLAHQVAVTCYTQITGNAPQNWALVQGEAIQ